MLISAKGSIVKSKNNMYGTVGSYPNFDVLYTE